jgi:hypothetical protein
MHPILMADSKERGDGREGMLEGWRWRGGRRTRRDRGKRDQGKRMEGKMEEGKRIEGKRMKEKRMIEGMNGKHLPFALLLPSRVEPWHAFSEQCADPFHTMETTTPPNDGESEQEEEGWPVDL